MRCYILLNIILDVSLRMFQEDTSVVISGLSEEMAFHNVSGYHLIPEGSEKKRKAGEG